jgi:hypothetical protein
MSNLHRAHSIDASCHVSVNLALYCTLHVGIHILIFFLAHLAKGNVGFWHHLAYVVCCLSSVNSGFRGGDLKKLANQKQELHVEGYVW